MPTQKIYINTLAQIGAKILTALISIVMIKVITNYLDVAGYGLYSKVYNYLSIFAVIADLGLYTITVRELSAHADDRVKVQKISGNVLTLRTLSGLFIIGTSLFIALFLPGYNSFEALIGIMIAGGFTLAGLINSSLMSYLQATLRTEFSLVANTAGKLLTFGMILLFVAALSSISHPEKFALVMFAGLSGNILMTSLTWWYVSRFEKVQFSWDSEYIRHIVLMSLPYGFALFLNVIFFKVDTILLSVMTEKTLADTVVALYALPMKIVEVGMMYGTIFLNSLLPVLTSAVEKKDTKQVHSLTAHAWNILLFFGIGIAAGGYLLAPEIIRLISSAKYIDTVIYGVTTVDVFRIVVWIFLFYFLSSLFTYTLIARSEQKKMLTINFIVALVNIIGNIIVIPKYSLIGSAYVTLASQILLLGLTWFIGRRNILFQDILRTTIGIIVLGGACFFISFLVLRGMSGYGLTFRFILTATLFSALYLGSAVLFRYFVKMKKSQ